MSSINHEIAKWSSKWFMAQRSRWPIDRPLIGMPSAFMWYMREFWYMGTPISKLPRYVVERTMEDFQVAKDTEVHDIIENGFPQVNLADFSDPEEFENFRTVCDRKPDKEDSSEVEFEPREGHAIMHGWYETGAISREIQPQHHQVMGTMSDLDVVGYSAAVRYGWDPPIDITNFHSIMLKLRTDGRCYFMALKPYSVSQEKGRMFQTIIRLPKTADGEWDYLEIPLAQFLPWDTGRFMPVESYGDDIVKHVDNFGFSCVGGSGPFELELGWVRLCRKDSRFVAEDPDAKVYQLLDTLEMTEDQYQHLFIYQDHLFKWNKWEDEQMLSLGSYTSPRASWGKMIMDQGVHTGM